MNYPHGNLVPPHQNMTDPQIKLQAANAAAAAAVHQAAMNASTGTAVQPLKKQAENSVLSPPLQGSAASNTAGQGSLVQQTQGAVGSIGTSTSTTTSSEGPNSVVSTAAAGASGPGMNMNNNSTITTHLAQQNGLIPSATRGQKGDESATMMNQIQAPPTNRMSMGHVSMSTTTAVTSSASSMGMMSDGQQGQGAPPLTLATGQQPTHPMQRHDSLSGAGGTPGSIPQLHQVCRLCVYREKRGGVIRERGRENVREREEGRKVGEGWKGDLLAIIKTACTSRVHFQLHGLPNTMYMYKL